MAKELVECIKCKQLTAEKLVYRLPRPGSSRDLEKLLGKYELNETVEYICSNCGYRFS